MREVKNSDTARKFCDIPGVFRVAIYMIKIAVFNKDTSKPRLQDSLYGH